MTAVTTGGPANRKRGRTRGGMSRNAGSDVRAAYLFIAPAVIGFLVFVGYPLIRSFYLALTKYNGLTDPVFVGLGNFRRLFTTDPAFWPALRATGYLVLLYVPLSLILGLALAMFCNQRFAGVRVVRTLAYLPVVLPAVATITLWKFILDPQVGLMNTILDRLGLPTSLWLQSSTMSMPSVVLVMLWGVGGTMIIFLAALQSVPTELYEAAKVDGAGPWSVFFRITMPMISPIMLLQVILQTTAALQTFNQPKILTNGGPGFSTKVLMLSIYENGFPTLGRIPQLGYASAQVWVLFVIIIAVIALTAKFSSLWTYSDSTSD
ncbi:multiple sugar transport system permease protein [Kribbella pratensis]|jgi:multiple sugar transport system permease protein|uniref:Multiple sugar transport system permease protein n=1 Tax=Kribbella pratensis TaxID=2512112 RepID=A0ABY2F8F3_9ACTN|nr:sugar ABC transporter permease [Kribbella pratensis]TDW86870.1 multiple sugar transport system permease protein [Kribbella pratensis]